MKFIVIITITELYNRSLMWEVIELVRVMCIARDGWFKKYGNYDMIYVLQ